MSGFFSSLVNRVTGPRLSPSQWDSATPIPPGMLAHKQSFKLPITTSSTITKVATGAWSHGTVVFEVAENVQPPSYDIAVNVLTAQDQKHRGGPQLGDGEGFLEVEVEARSNDEELWSGSKVAFKKVGANDVQLIIETPSMSPSKVASQLSFHVRFSFPPNIPSIAALITSASQWRTIGRPSLSSLHIHQLSIATANVSITFDQVHGDSISLKTANSPIEGKYEAKEILVKSSNGDIGGVYSAREVCDLHTTNGRITATPSARIVKVYNRNGSVRGDFTAEEKLSIENANSPIEGKFVSHKDTSLTNDNSPIKGTFTFGPGYHLLRTSNALIAASITLIGETDKLGTPPLLAQDEKKQLAAGGKGGLVRLEAATSNGRIELEVVQKEDKVVLEAKAHSSNSGVEIKHVEPYSGKFELSTSNSSVKVDAPPSHTIEYSQISGGKAVGTISNDTGDSTSENTLVGKTSNAPASVVVR